MWSLKNYTTIAFNMDHMRVKGKTTKRNKKTNGYFADRSFYFGKILRKTCLLSVTTKQIFWTNQLKL